MSLLKPVAIAVIASLLAAPAYAEPSNPAAKLSLTPKAQPTRKSSKVRESENLKGGTIPLIAIGAAAVVGAAFLLGNNDSKPASM